MSVGVSNEGKNFTIHDTKISEFSTSVLFATNIRVFNEITGLLFLDDSKSRAKVEFSCMRKNITPFGKFLNFSEDEVADYEIEMAKYEDGWRIINNENNVNYNPKDYPKIFESSYSSNSNLTFSSDKTEENQEINNVKITNESGTSPCKVKDIIVENGDYYIVVDYTRIIGKDKYSSAPIYENKNPKLRTFKITTNSTITILEMAIQEKKYIFQKKIRVT